MQIEKGLPFNKVSDVAIFDYNHKKNLYRGILYIFLGLAVIILIASYVLFMRNSSFFLSEWFKLFYKHVTSQISIGSVAGIFYTTFFGGLFFIFMPLEVIFINFLKNGASPSLLISVYLLGYLCSYSFNYIFGSRLQNLSKKIITLKKFYKMKGIINKYGAAAIFVFNLLPLPSQPLAAILGVFRYNKARFYFWFMLGEGIKYLLIIIFYTTIF